MSQLTLTGCGPSGAGSSLLDGLVEYWALDELSDGSAPVTRAGSHNSYDFSDINNVASDAGLVHARAITVDDAVAPPRYLRRAIAPFQFNAGAMTVAAWHYMIEAPPVAPLYSYLLCTASNDWTGGWMLFISGLSTVFYLSHKDGTNSVSHAINPEGVPTLVGAWWLSFAWYDPVADTNNAQMFSTNLVGVVDVVADTKGPVNSNLTYITLGVLANEINKPYHGKIGPCAVWNRCLTDAERLAFWNAGAGVVYPF